jgi:hypothetical protein
MSERAKPPRDGGRGQGGLSSQCSAIKGDGERCRGRATEGSQWCYSHNPNHQDQHRRNGSKGASAVVGVEPVLHTRWTRLKLIFGRSSPWSAPGTWNVLTPTPAAIS